MTQKPWEHAKDGGSESDLLATRFVSSLDVDTRLAAIDLRGSLAHAQMLERVGLLTGEDLDAIRAGLAEIAAEIDDQGDAWPGWRVELEDVHMCVEAALIEKAGDAGRRLHTGRSRNDQVATDLLVWVREAAGTLAEGVRRLCVAYVGLAERSADVVMPSYTHLQRAQPIVAGAECLAWCTMLHGNLGPLAACVPADARSALGGGAVAGSSLPIDAADTAAALGFAGPPLNSIAATASRDAALDFTYACARIAMHLSRWAEQWITYCSEEFGFLTLDPAHTTGSSMMPQKRNPDMLELLRGKSSTPYGSLVAMLTMCKGMTVGYNRDLQEDKRHVFSAFDTVADCLAMAERVVAGASFNKDRITASLGRGHLDATSLADYLVLKGVPFRTAHQIVGRLVRACDDAGVPDLAGLPLDQMQAVEPRIQADVTDWLGEANVVRRYRSAGNSGVSGLAAQLTHWRTRLGIDGP